MDNGQTKNTLIHGTIVFFDRSRGFGFIRPDRTEIEGSDLSLATGRDYYFNLRQERCFRLLSADVTFAEASSGRRPAGNGGDRVIFRKNLKIAARALHWGFEADYLALTREVGRRPLLRAVEMRRSAENGFVTKRELWQGYDLAAFRRKYPKANGRDSFAINDPLPPRVAVRARFFEVYHPSGGWIRVHAALQKAWLQVDPWSDDRWQVCLMVDAKESQQAEVCCQAALAA